MQVIAVLQCDRETPRVVAEQLRRLAVLEWKNRQCMALDERELDELIESARILASVQRI